MGVIAVAAAVAIGRHVWELRQSRLPAGIASGNGRVEADEIDIDTKFAGRIADLSANEGDMVRAGQVIAHMDTRDLAASLRSAVAQVRQARRTVDEDRADVEQQRTQVTLAKAELDRYASLVKQDYVTHEDYDERRQQMDGAAATLKADVARTAEAQQALDAATHLVELDEVNIADNSLVAPRDGRIQYRIANVGEVLPAGGKVFTMLDISSVYMDIYLPTAEAGRVRPGAPARIVLDAYPQNPIAAQVSFLGTQAQFTPKAVETKSDRDKLMFRVKVRIDPDVLRAHAEAVRTGLPGVAYVNLDARVPWPPWLASPATH